MTSTRIFMLMLALLFGGGSLVACSDGYFEERGEAVDDYVDETEDAID